MSYNKSKKSKISLEDHYIGIVKIAISFNNTIITLTDRLGNVIAWSNSGMCGFKGAKKSTPFAAQTVAEQVKSKILSAKIKKIFIEIKGPGAGRESALRAFASSDYEVISIRDVTALPHNGCRLPKKRRI